LTNAEIVVRYLELGCAGDLDGAAGWESPDITFWLSGRLANSGSRTVAQYKRASAGVRSAFPGGYSLKIVSVVEQGSRVAIEARGNGTLADGSPYRPDYAIFAEVENGFITSLREYIDTEYVSDTFAIPIRRSQRLL
jgi:ketosteroid isomerase-like protein